MIKVLIVEDDPMVAQINRRYVESVEGFQVIGVAGNGEEAIGMIEEKDPHLLILDIYMPRLNGMELLKRIRREGLKVDVILVTAEKEVDNIDEVLKWGAVDYLIKPFEFPRFKKALNNYRERRKAFFDLEEADQKDIDRILRRRIQEEERAPVEKGLHRKTLERIHEYMRNAGTPKTANEVATELGMARVTVRRYLEYMVSRGDVELEVDYGKVGRPKHLYRSR